LSYGFNDKDISLNPAKDELYHGIIIGFATAQKAAYKSL
jgi:hypothetical protein